MGYLSATALEKVLRSEMPVEVQNSGYRGFEVALLEPCYPMYLNESTNKHALKEDHHYYYQMQVQMYCTCTSLNYGFFVIFAGPEIAYWYVKFNRVLIEETIPVPKQFWSTTVMPELIDKHFTFKYLLPSNDKNDLIKI